jgi:hypothetical protein
MPLGVIRITADYCGMKTKSINSCWSQNVWLYDDKAFG